MRMPPPPRHIKHNISHSPSGWKSTGRLAAWRDVGKSPFPGCCPHRVGGRGSSRGLSIKTNPSHEGPTLLTSLITPKPRLLTPSHWGVGSPRMNLGGR